MERAVQRDRVKENKIERKRERDSFGANQREREFERGLSRAVATGKQSTSRETVAKKRDWFTWESPQPPSWWSDVGSASRELIRPGIAYAIHYSRNNKRHSRSQRLADLLSVSLADRRGAKDQRGFLNPSFAFVSFFHLETRSSWLILPPYFSTLLRNFRRDRRYSSSWVICVVRCSTVC